MPSITAWLEKRDTWLAFCNGMGEATRTISASGRIYYSFKGPYGEIFPSWKRCDEFMRRRLQNLPILQIEGIKEESHYPVVETVLSRCRSAEIKSFTVDEEKLDTIIGSNNFESEFSTPESNHLLAEPSASSDEKWVEVHADLLSSKISGIRKTSDSADVKCHHLRRNRDPDETSSGFKNFCDSESRKRVIAEMQPGGNETLNFSSQFGTQAGHAFRGTDLRLEGLGNFDESTSKEPFVNHLSGQSTESSAEDQRIIVRNPTSGIRTGEHEDEEDPNPDKSNENVLLLQAPDRSDENVLVVQPRCGGDHRDKCKRINHKSEEEEEEKRINNFRSRPERARLAERIRRNHERAVQLSKIYGPAQKPAGIHLLLKRSEHRNTPSTITTDSDMLLSILWRKYMLSRRSKRRSRT